MLYNYSFFSMLQIVYSIFLLVIVPDFFSFYLIKMIFVLGYTFLCQGILDQTHFNNLFWSYRMVIFINVIVMPCSFLKICFMNDNTTRLLTIICLSLYCMSLFFFFLPEYYASRLLLSTGFGICCSL